MALELNGTTGVSLVQDGVITDANLPAGSVLQVVMTSGVNTTGSTTSTDWLNTVCTGSITPSSTSSKILIMYDHGIAFTEGTANHRIQYEVLNSTSSTALGRKEYIGVDSTPLGSLLNVHASGQVLDSPSSTSSQTYVLRVRKAGDGSSSETNAIFVNWRVGAESQMILMEIAG